MKNVIKKCIPGGIALALSVLSVYVCSMIGLISCNETEYRTLMVAVVMFTGTMSLIRICKPYNGYRVVLVILTFALVVTALTGLVDLCALIGLPKTPFGELVSLFNLEFANITFLTSVVLINYMLLNLLTELLDKIKITSKDEDKKPQTEEN